MNAEWPQAARPKHSPKPESGEQKRDGGYLPDEEVVSEPSQASETQQTTKVLEPNPMKRLREPEEAREQLSEQVLDVIDQDITWVKRRLQSPNKPSRHELLELEDQLNQRRDKLEGILANRFQEQGDAPERRAIQDAILEVDEAREWLRGWLQEEKSVEAKRQPYLSAGERDQFTRLRAWANTPEATQERRKQKEDNLRHRLGEIERDMPRDPSEAEQRQKDVTLLQELIQHLKSPVSPEKEILAQKWEALDRRQKALRKQVIEKYGESPERISAGPSTKTQILLRTSNAASALMGTEEPYQAWLKLRAEQNRLEQEGEKSSPAAKTEPAPRTKTRGRKNAA